jgi:hypothetical protein
VSDPSHNPSIAAVYLARHAEGLQPLRRFLDAYRRNPAGIEHRLVVIYKGYRPPALAEARALFAAHPNTAIEVDDTGFDIGSYLEAAMRLDDDQLCLMNTFTEPAAPGWLAMLAKRLQSEAVGIVGAMGSYESLHDTIKLSCKAAWLAEDPEVEYSERFDRYFGMYLEHAAPKWEAKRASAQSNRLGAVFAKALTPRKWLLRRRLDESFEVHWKGINQAERLNDWSRIPAFPNPHIRTTGFLVRRHEFLRCAWPTHSKRGSYEFESGHYGLTATLRRAGQAILVVGRDDREFDIPDWPSSKTFRLGDQANLLVTDGQSRAWAALDPARRATFVRFTWGDYVGSPPSDFPEIGLEFGRQPISPTLRQARRPPAAASEAHRAAPYRSSVVEREPPAEEIAAAEHFFSPHFDPGKSHFDLSQPAVIALMKNRSG